MFYFSTKVFKTFKRLIKFLLDFCKRHFGFFDPNHRITRNEPEKAAALFVDQPILNIWNKCSMFKFINGQLRRRIKRTDGFYGLCSELNTVRMVVGIRVHIKQSATYGKLSGFNNEVDTVKTIFQQHISYKVHVYKFSGFKPEGVLF